MSSGFNRIQIRAKDFNRKKAIEFIPKQNVYCPSVFINYIILIYIYTFNILYYYIKHK